MLMPQPAVDAGLYLLDHVEEPELEFGFGQLADYPRDGLLLFGPVRDTSLPTEVRYGVIGEPMGIERLERWAARVAGFIPRFVPPRNPDAEHHTAFPGFEAVFQARWPTRASARLAVSTERLADVLRLANHHEAVKTAVDLFVRPLIEYSNHEENQPQFWFVVIPEAVWERGRPQSKRVHGETLPGHVTVSAARAKRLKDEPTLFGDEEAEADVYRYVTNFRRQLKARLLAHKIVTQIVRETTLAPNDFLNRAGYPIRKLEDDATIAWKLCTTAYYKAIGNPWYLAGVRPGVCYVGLVYKRTDPDSNQTNACCAAQMFLAFGDGVVFRGAVGPWYTPSTKQFHLSHDAARELIELVVSEYRRQHDGSLPKELFIHGRARSDEEEWQGFRSAVPAGTNLVGVQIRDAANDLKLFRRGTYPVLRGTMLKVSEDAAFVWTSGYVPRLGTYIGMETPNPIFVRVQYGECSINVVVRDVMVLTKINYNTCLFNDRMPVTIHFANAIGDILIAAPLTNEPKLPFKFYI
jgi:hypothetical protein